MNEVHAVGDEVKFTWETDPIHNQTNLGLWTEFRDQIITKSLWLGSEFSSISELTAVMTG